jgi:leucyl/phenylalanyl-tRNA---protein transferase
VTRIPALLAVGDTASFPDPELALREPDGLLAIGGDLAASRLLEAYRHGIFPWYSQGQPILWWSPDPRLVFRTGHVHLSRRFRRALRGSRWQVVADRDFTAAIDACASVRRPGQPGTWITREMRAGYLELNRLGHAHSIEVRDGDELAGVLYGVAVGHMFFGESMASLQPGGSKVALAALALRLRGWGWPLLDAQVENPHLLALGAERWPRKRFLREVGSLAAIPEPPGDWRERFGILPAAALSDRPPDPAPE